MGAPVVLTHAGWCDETQAQQGCLVERDARNGATQRQCVHSDRPQAGRLGCDVGSTGDCTVAARSTWLASPQD